jgi:hypothetical protein
MWNVPQPHEEWIENFLEVRTPSPGPPSWLSTFSAVVRDARRLTGRNTTTGLIENESRTDSWLGALGYLVMLDQVGECFRPATLPRQAPHPGNVAKALTYFAPRVSDGEILVVYALRCAFVHQYGLSNWGDIPHAAGLTHSFQLTASATAPLIEFPKMPWTGDLRIAGLPTNQTIVNVRALGNLAESVVATVQETNRAGLLEIELPDGINELSARFTMTRPAGEI